MTQPAGDPHAQRPEHSWVPSLSLRDVLSTAGHSRDFNGSRAEYINRRLNSLALALAALMALWIAVDYRLVAAEAFAALLSARLASVVVLLLVWWRRGDSYSLPGALLRLAALVAAILAFFAATRLAIDGRVDDLVTMGYGLFPFLLVALQAVFPLTLIEGLLLVLPVVLAVILVNAAVGDLLALGSLGDLWLLLLLTAIAIWVQLAQLDMLLRLYRQASRDPLTLLINRRVLMDRLADEHQRARRYGRRLALLMLDLDRFKRINDERGHLAGDAVLRQFAEHLTALLRHVDMVGRYGGEEFIAVLPETDSEGAREVAERIRAHCHDHPATAPDGTAVHYTVSIGVTELADDAEVQAVIDRADKALYQAKSAGRDRVVVVIPAGPSRARPGLQRTGP